MTAAAEVDRDSEPPDAPVPASATSSFDGASFDGATFLSGAGSSAGKRGAAMPSEEQLLDVLYEVLAQGIPARSSLTQGEVETFLHQHARQTKPVAEMLAFFERHGLPTDASAYGSDRELVELASGLQKEHHSMMPGFGPMDAAPEPPTLPPGMMVAPQPLTPSVAPLTMRAPVVAAQDGDLTGRHTAAAAVVVPPPRSLRWLGIVAGALTIASVVTFALSYQRATSLEQRLDQARMQQRSTDAALTKLEQRAESLQGALKQSEQERHQQSSQFQTTLEEQAQRRATEELAIERVLGPRYLKLRQKFAGQAAATSSPPVHH